ncbi:MAG: hypothetical protein IPO26_18210 [Saprospiraceae bacterium]|nr:hypothetical protein [Saprospiraceae bacterium]
MAVLYGNRMDARIFEGKRNLIMGGSLRSIDDNLTIGDVSSHFAQRMPAIGKAVFIRRTLKTTCC